MNKPNTHGQEVHSSSRETDHQRPLELYRQQTVRYRDTIYQTTEFSHSCNNLIQMFLVCRQFSSL